MTAKALHALSWAGPDDLDAFISKCHRVYQHEFIEYCRRLGCISFQMSYHLPPWVHWLSLLQTTCMSFFPRVIPSANMSSLITADDLDVFLIFLCHPIYQHEFIDYCRRLGCLSNLPVSSHLPTWVHWLLQMTWLYFFPNVIPSTNMSSLVTADDLDVFISKCHTIYQHEFID